MILQEALPLHKDLLGKTLKETNSGVAIAVDFLVVVARKAE